MKSAIAILFFASATGAAQSFETASIKPVADISTCRQSMIQPMLGGGLRVECMPLKALITWAYSIQDYQLSGGPGWLTSVDWNIMARSESAAPADSLRPEDLPEAQRKIWMDDVRQRLRSLLAERFQLKLRHDSKEQTIYSLTITKSGPRMKEVDHAGMIRRGKAQIVSTGTTMALLCSYLGIALGRPVTDRTGLTSHYAFEMNWTPDGIEPVEGAAAPSLMTALQEQLGLRLEAAKGPVEMLFIENIEKALEN